MSLSPLALLAILAAAPPKPGPTPAAAPIPAGKVRLVRVDPHRAALFLAEVYRVQVIVVGGTKEPVTVGLTTHSAEVALREFAQAAGLSVSVDGDRYLLAPGESLATRGKGESLQGGRRVTLNFLRAEASRVVEMLGQLENLTIVGPWVGRVSMWLKNVPSREVLSSLVRLAGLEAKVQGSAVTLSGLGTLPETAASTGEGCPEGARLGPDLPCVPASALEVCATAMLGKQSLALIRRHGAGPGSALAAAVRRNARVGEPALKVASVDSEGVTLDDGTRLQLGGTTIRACNEATLRGFVPPGGKATHEVLAPETFEWVDPKAAATHVVPCLDGESEPKCDLRGRQVALAGHPRHRILSSTMESETDGVLTKIEVDGRVVEQTFRNHEGAAEFLRGVVARGGKAVLLSAEMRRDPRTRRAVIQLQDAQATVEQRSRERARIEWKPGTDAVEATVAAQELAERTGVMLLELAPQPGGAIRAVVACP